MNIFKLAAIENYKLWKRRSVRVLFVLMLALSVCYCAGAKYIDYVQTRAAQTDSASSSAGTDSATVSVTGSAADSASAQTMNWKQALQADIAAMQAQIKAAEKSSSRTDDVQIGPLKKQIAEAQYRIAHNLDSSKDTKSLWSWMTMMADNGDVPSINYFIALFCVIFIATAVAGEFTEGTMKMAISRPFSRGQILTAKIMSSLLFLLVLTGVAFGVTFLGAGLLFGFKNMGATTLLWTGSQIVQVPQALNVLAYYGLNLLTTLFFMALALLLSSAFRSRSIATGFSIFMLFIGASLFRLLAIFFDWGKFTAFPVSGFSSFLSTGASLPGTSLGFALIVCGVYAAVFTAGSYLLFQKRDI